MASAFGSPIPSAPAYRAPGGVATDITGGVAAFAQRLQEQRERAALEAYRQAQLKLGEDKLTQDTEQAGLDRELKKYLGELQAEVERERNKRIREDQERDRSAAIETSTRDLRGEFQRQLGERGKQKTADAYRGSQALTEKGRTAPLTPQEQEELKRLGNVAGLGLAGISPELNRADSLSAFESAATTATGPLSSEAATRLRQQLGFDKPPVPSSTDRAGLEAEIHEAFAAGVPHGRIIAKVREDIRNGSLPPDAERWAADLIRQARSGAGGKF
jgi:hypothetical protein